MLDEEFKMQVVSGLSALTATVETEFSHIKGDVSEMKGDIKDAQAAIQEVSDIAKASKPHVPCKQKDDCHMETVEATVSWNRRIIYALLVATLTVCGKIVWSSYDSYQMMKNANASPPIVKEVKKIN